MGCGSITQTVNINGRTVFSSRYNPYCCMPNPMMMSCFGFGFPCCPESAIGFGLGASLPYALPGICKGIGQGFSWLGTKVIAPAAEFVWNNALKPAGKGIGWLGKNVWKGLEWAGEGIFNGIGWLGSNIGKGIGWLGSGIGKGIGWVGKGIGWVGKGICNGIGWLGSNIGKGIAKGIGAVGKAVAGGFSAIGKGISNLWNKIF